MSQLPEAVESEVELAIRLLLHAVCFVISELRAASRVCRQFNESVATSNVT